MSNYFARLVLHVILLCQVVLLSCNDKFILVLLSRPQHAQEDFEEETMEDDEAELTLNKVEEEMMVRLVLTDQIPFCCFLPPGNLPLHLDNKDIFKNTAAVLP